MSELVTGGIAAEKKPPSDPVPSDDDLLRIIAEKADPEAAKAAWATFYTGHVQYLHAVCRRAYVHKLGSAAVEDIVADTFLRVYMTAAASYRPTAQTDPAMKRLQIKAWLAAIAEHIALDQLCGRKTDPLIHLDQDQWQEVAQVAGEPESKLVAEVCRVMHLVLKDNEQDVIRSTFLWNAPGKDFQRMPESELAELAGRCGTNAANIRKIRERALKKLKDALAPIMASTSEMFPNV